MNKRAVAVLLWTLALTASPALAQEARRAYSEPALNPDGSEIAFVSGGDIWTVPSQGGGATLLVSHEADESRPLYSPDGRSVAFVSDRGGDDDIYLLTLASGEVRRLTYGDGAEELDAWSPDGAWIYFADGRSDPGGHPDIWRIQASGGTPMQVAADPYSPEFHAAVHPDGGTLAIAANARMAQSQWWRRGHSHIDESEIWLVTPGETPVYERLSDGTSKNVWPQWTSGGDEVVYVSDRSGTENVWIQATGSGEARRLTDFDDGRVLFASASADGASLVFERDFGVWKMDLPTGEARPVPIAVRGVPQRPGPEHSSLSSGFGSLALSPDGKKAAFVVRGDVFAVGTEDGGSATRVTRSVALETHVVWAPDSRRIAYVSRRDGHPGVFLYDFVSMQETALTEGGASDVAPRFSPDGTKLAYQRDGSQIRVHDLDSGEDTQVASGQLGRFPFTSNEGMKWSPDGEWIAYFSGDARMFTNVWVVPAAGGDAVKVSGLANSSAGSLVWAPDGKALFFDTQHRTEDGRIARVDLVPRTPLFGEDRFQELFEPEPASSEQDDAERGSTSEAEESGTRVDTDGIRRRLTLLPTGVDVGTLAISPDGKTLVFTAAAEGQQNLYALSIDPEADGPRVTRQITATPGFKSTPRFTADGSEVYYLDRGRIQVANVESGRTTALAVTARLDVDFDLQKTEVFAEGWSYLRDHYYDPGYHGADWEAVRRTFEPFMRGAATGPEFSRLMNMMVGELNGSHLGHRIRGNSGTSSGVLGLRYDRSAMESSGVLRVTDVIGLGPAQVAGGIAAGDYLVSVDGRAMAAGVNLDEVLEGKVGRKVDVVVSDDASGSDGRTVSLKPISYAQERALAYRDWVEANRAYVERVSGGRLGYVHMAAMGAGNLAQLLVDLDAENHGREGVVIDIRNNNGGFVNAYALDIFARRGYLTMETRGYPEAPARSMLGQRSLERGTVLVVNQHTLSDGEDFTEGYRALGLGKVVGEPTAGWIVFTWGLTLVDGSTLRMPRSRIRGVAGDDMELNPRSVDVEVVRPMGEGYSGRDSQLDAAVRVLLGGG